MSCLYPYFLRFGKQFLRVRCNKCVECKKFKAREWSMRCVLESKMHNYNLFVTLTYDDEHLPLNFFNDEFAIATLVKRDYQNYFKRLRSYGLKFRYFIAGEYGDKNERPHFHILFFGLSVAQASLLKREWDKGFVDVSNFNDFNVAYYVAGYVQKKLYGGDKNDESVLRLPAFSQASINPPLGWQKFFELWNLGVITLKDYFIKINDFSYPVPRIFSQKLGIKHSVDFLILKQEIEDTKKIKNFQKRGLTFSNYYNTIHNIGLGKESALPNRVQKI